ncbi:MAG TPA: ABC transporter permease [Vicinamibacterales bacterium]
MHDVRLAFRSLRATPVVTAVAILSLTLGIGANTAIFSIVNSLLLRPLPVLNPSELAVVTSVTPERWYGVSYPVWKEIRDRRVFDRAFTWGTDRAALGQTGEITFARAIWASGNTFDVLGVPAILGRTFTADDDRAGGGRDGAVAVISHDFWRQRYGARPDAIGQVLSIDRVPFTIVGVLPPGFFGLNVGAAFDVMLPIETGNQKRLDAPMWTWLQVMVRRLPGQTAEELSRSLASAQPAVRAATMPSFTHADDREEYLSTAWVVKDAPEGISRFRRQYGDALVAVQAIVVIVLLVACVNIATLMLGKSATRRYEMSVRLALGAPRGRLIRQLLVESIVLSAIGASLGLLFASWGSRLLVAQLSTWASTAFLDLSIDWRVLGAAAIATIATALLFGTMPAFKAAHVLPVDALKQQARGIAGRATLGFGERLVIVQIALSLVLVAGSGLFLRSFVALAYRDLGFDRGRVIVAAVDAGRTTVPAAIRPALFERVREKVATVPGVESAATSLATPLASVGVRVTPDIAMPDNPAFGGRAVRILTNPVSPNWFRTFGTRLVAGRDFDERDRHGARDVAIVNQAFTRVYLAGAAPIGQTLTVVEEEGKRRPLEVVGVVADAAFTTVRDAVEPTIYTPLAQRLHEDLLTSMSSISLSIRARSGLSPERLTEGTAAAIAQVDRNLAVSFQTVAETLSVFYIRERLLAILSGFFGGLALLLAAAGLYGVAAYSVSVRRSEIGVRMALGAQRRAVIRLVLLRLVWRAALGVALGLLVSGWAAGFVRALLYDLDARDPLTLALAALTLMVVAIAAGALPAWRASRIDPAEVLREK